MTDRKDTLDVVLIDFMIPFLQKTKACKQRDMSNRREMPEREDATFET